MPLKVASDVHLEPETVAGIHQIGDDLRLGRLPGHEAVGLREPPAALLRLHRVRRDASLDELAVRCLDPAEERVDPPEQRALIDVAGGREHAPDRPLDAVVQRRGLVRIDDRIRGVLGLR